MCIFLNFFGMAIMLFFSLTTCINLFLTHQVQSLSKLFLFFLAFICFALVVVFIMLVASTKYLESNIVRFSESNKSDLSELSKLMSTFTKLYSVF